MTIIGALDLCPIDVVPLPFQALDFPLLCALWGSDLWWIFFPRGWCCSGPWVGPMSGQMLGEVLTALRCPWVELVKWGRWCTLEAPPGHFVMCHASLLPPAPFSWGPCVLGTGGRLAKLSCLFCAIWGQKRGQTHALHEWEMQESFAGEEAVVWALCSVFDLWGPWGCCGKEEFHFLLDPSGLRHKWDLSQHGNALLMLTPLTVPSGLGLSDAALAWVPLLCTLCCGDLCYSQLSSCQWQFPDCPVSPGKYTPEHIPYPTASGDTAQQPS